MTLRQAERLLADAGIDGAAAEARMLFSRILGVSQSHLLAFRDEVYADERLAKAVARRATREPLQYILGEWDFMGLTFAVSPDCLIPRPDTETLVENTLMHLPKSAKIADFCTGSGCIGIALCHLRPDITVTAVEICEKTARMAEENARRLGVADRFTVLRGDITTDCLAADAFFDGIVSNPPYITLDEMMNLEPELHFEPRIALTDEGDGLSVIRGVLAAAARHLTPQGVLLMEFGASQGASVCALAESMGFSGEILRDLGGHDRVYLARRAFQSAQNRL